MNQKYIDAIHVAATKREFLDGPGEAALAAIVTLLREDEGALKAMKRHVVGHELAKVSIDALADYLEGK